MQQSLLRPMSADEVADRASRFVRGLGGDQRPPAARRRLAPEPEPRAAQAPALALVEAAPAPAEPAPATKPAGRDFSSPREVVWHPDGRRFVLREYVGGAHVYHAFERSDALFYEVEADDLGLDVGRPYGRIDTRRSARAFNPITEYDALVDYRRSCYREALELIREVCPETIVTGRLGEPGNAVFEGPGRVLLLTRPETRYRAAMAARRPE